MNNHQVGNFNVQLRGVKGEDRLGPSSDPPAPPVIIRIPLRGIFPACSAAQLSSPAHYITMTTTAVGQPDRFITGSEPKEEAKPNVAAAPYSHM